MYTFVETRWPLMPDEQEAARFLRNYADVSLSKALNGSPQTRVRSGAYALFRDQWYGQVCARLGMDITDVRRYFFDVSEDTTELIGTSVEKVEVA